MLDLVQRQLQLCPCKYQTLLVNRFQQGKYYAKMLFLTQKPHPHAITFNNSRRHDSFFFYKLVSSSDFVYRTSEVIIISENQSIVRSIDQSEVGLYIILRNGPEKSGKKSVFVNTEKMEFESENRKLEN